MNKLFILAAITLSLSSQAWAEAWNLPQVLSTENTQLTFEVDSTWHLVEGIVKEIRGRLWLNESRDFRSVRGEIVFPVRSMDTDRESRDEKMREVMHADQYPEIRVELLSVSPGICDDKLLTDQQRCEFQADSVLKINNISKKLVLNCEVKRLANAFEITGTTSTRWEEFDIEDPSIFVAKLHKDVVIKFKVVLKEEER